MWDDRDGQSETPDLIRDEANRSEPALQEYDWAQQRRQEKRIPIEIINSILAEMDRHEEEDLLPN